MTFDTYKTVKYWLEGAAYDLETAKSLLESKRFPHALFFAHLALEKVLKALVVKSTEEHAPYTHSLTSLANQTKVKFPDSVLDQLAESIEFHLESRYPDEKKDFYRRCTEEFAHKNSMRWRTCING